jgi:hypothetical protein
MAGFDKAPFAVQSPPMKEALSVRKQARDVAHEVARRVGLLKRASLARRLANGVVAGAVGTSALNLVTYLDMALRARPASETPAEAVRKLEDKARITLADQGRESKEESNRRQALGALLGFVTGVGIGGLYGLVRPSIRSIPVALAGVAVGLAAMAGSDLPATALGATDPEQWAFSDWLADLMPHLAYGFSTALAFDAITDPYD